MGKELASTCPALSLSCALPPLCTPLASPLSESSEGGSIPVNSATRESAEKVVLEQFGFPLTGTETRRYTNHALSYDQAKRVPRWVLEHISKNKIVGDADRKHCKFKPDPGVPSAFSARNEDYVGSGWSRGHMAPAGNNKFSSKAMAETFYLSNIVPQDFDNNSGYWNRIEMYCRELTERFEDVWIVSGPLTLPHTSDGKKTVSYQLLPRERTPQPAWGPGFAV
ncbi:hypothetical protein U0070_009269 [Myodes glareolus]|uniref:Nuclease EXOG, mitochondrial n=1 Tax=Myodes glareolus TaxID=447135 RepID=A0AAW0IQT7_MYOGA